MIISSLFSLKSGYMVISVASIYIMATTAFNPSWYASIDAFGVLVLVLNTKAFTTWSKTLNTRNFYADRLLGINSCVIKINKNVRYKSY